MKFWIILTVLIFSSSIVAQTDFKENIFLGLGHTEITENGKNILKVSGACGYGEVVGFHLPKKGWFIASTKTFEGYDFQKIGKLDNNKISFRIDNREYEIISDQPISSQVKSLELWITRITPPADKNQADSELISCSSSFEYWLETILQKK